MATPEEISAFINHCPRYLSKEVPQETDWVGELYKRMVIPIGKCCEALLDRAVDEDVFLDIYKNNFSRDDFVYSPDTEELFLSGVKSIINLRKILGNLIPIASFFEVKTKGITATVDLLLKDKEFMIGVLDFTRAPISMEELKEKRPMMQAITRAYNAQFEHHVSTMCLIAPVTGQTAFYNYDKYDMSEYIGQAIDQGMVYRRFCSKCKSCINKELCVITE